MKMVKIIAILMSCCGLTLIACDDFSYKRSENNNDSSPKQILYDKTKKEKLYNLGNTSGYELTATTTNNGETSEYIAAMKDHLIYRHYDQLTGGGFNYMVCRLINSGTSCAVTTYRDDLYEWGETVERGPEAFRSHFDSSTEPFYEASSPDYYEKATYSGTEVISNKSTLRFDYTGYMGDTTHLATFYVEEEYGLTVKSIHRYVRDHETLNVIEMNMTSFKIGDDVIVPQFKTI